MKIFIEKRTLKTDGTRTLRLIYDHGYTTKSNGSRQRKREHEVLDLFIYDKPKSMVLRIELSVQLASLITFNGKLTSKNKPPQPPTTRSGFQHVSTCCSTAGNMILALMSWIKTG